MFVAVDLKSTKFVGVRDEKMENATKKAKNGGVHDEIRYKLEAKGR